MSGNLTTYEVEIEVKKKDSCRYFSHLGMHVFDGFRKMIHQDARTPEQAARAASKYGKPITVRKATIENIDIQLSKNVEQLEVSLFENAIAMDEMIWKKRKRRINMKKEKVGLDK